jgi:hypothetical protein
LGEIVRARRREKKKRRNSISAGSNYASNIGGRVEGLCLWRVRYVGGGDGVGGVVGDLYDDALLAFPALSEEGCAGSVFEDFPDAVVHFGGTFEIPSCSNLTGN